MKIRGSRQQWFTIFSNENHQIYSWTPRLVSITGALDNFLARNWGHQVYSSQSLRLPNWEQDITS
jgi:hypothetical protein